MTTEFPDAQPPAADSSEPGLTIGELARRTGLNVATLRMWETRHGFPQARRLPSGHRRYDYQTADRVLHVQRLRAGGVRLETAIGQVTSGPAAAPPSIFAELRHRHPDLVPHRLRKATLLALTWALEDEGCARAESPWLFGAFQHERYYRQAQPRWRDLARTSRGAWALAEFDSPRNHDAPLLTEVALPESSPMRREWALVCVGKGFSAALTAWETPGQNHVPDRDRIFESVWSLEPVAVADAARSCALAAGELGHDTTAVLADLDRPVAPSSGDLKEATALFNRVIGYVERVR